MARYYATKDDDTTLDVTWGDTSSKSNPDRFDHRGYLSSDLDGRLVVLTLNTVPYSPNHFPSLHDSTNTARAPQRRYFCVHYRTFPPIIDSFSGTQMWEAEYIKTYKSLVGKFADVVKAQFFAHVHSIEFRIHLISEQHAQKEAGRTELVPPFMSVAISNNNPAFMI
ncbi:hypothetical protein GN958_ATG09948 [Phytophthora infestans]|uniref:Uncharacterized protein n=1 Tax=Phytophthora infestans TaxID=4787 RepID=A0A8S9UK27_PHYIN|nr:hypothetical protein GN958_ATG09948 [Phytophthora infestans]